MHHSSAYYSSEYKRFFNSYINFGKKCLNPFDVAGTYISLFINLQMGLMSPMHHS